MKKLTATMLMTLSLLLFGAKAGTVVSSQTTHGRLTNPGHLAGGSEPYILSEHLGSAPDQPLSSTGRLSNCHAGCDLKSDNIHCGVAGGAHSSAIDLHDPESQTVLGHSNSVQATIIPAQVLTTSVETTTCGKSCGDTKATRCRKDDFCYEVDGSLKSTTIDCAQQAECEDECFEESGHGSVCYEDYKTCGCQKNHGCGEFEDATEGICGPDCMTTFVDKDPDADIEERINHHIRKTISDVLSQIVESAICGSLKHTIDLDDVESI